MILTMMFGVLLSTMCDQEFTFLGATDSTLWIIEDFSGECESSRLIQISINDTSANILSTSFSEYKKRKKFADAFHKLEAEQTEALITKKNTLSYGKKWSIAKPPPNDSMYQRFGEEALSVPGIWLKANGDQGIIPPVFQNCSATLLYAHPGGCYINYEFDKAYFITKKNLLILFTKHPHRGAGGDTMHGFLVFRVK
jgi:hypothetical protein